MGGLSLMSVTVMMAVAVLERPKFRLPSMSVACTMMVYCDTFCKKIEESECSVIHLQRALSFSSLVATTDCDSQKNKKAEPLFPSIVAVRGLISNTDSQG